MRARDGTHPDRRSCGRARLRLARTRAGQDFVWDDILLAYERELVALGDYRVDPESIEAPLAPEKETAQA